MTISHAVKTRAAAPPEWATRLFASELAPLRAAKGEDGAVWSIARDRSQARISDQFKVNAGDYHARYSAAAHFQHLFQQALTKTAVQVAEAPLILDLGSGSGVNSIVPWFNLAPGARQVATDLSGELLAILADYALSEGLSDRVLCGVMDAMGDHVRPGQFDLVTGSSILHHLVLPNQGIRAAARALKPGGHAIFMEPFQGYGLIRLAYERILAEAVLRNDRLHPAVERALKGMVADIAARTMPDPTRPGFADLDDKWLFSREHIEHAAESLGFSRVRIVPHNDHDELYRDVASVQLRLAIGTETPIELPAWAIAILDSFDAALPPPVKRLLMLEGTIVMTKGG